MVLEFFCKSILVEAKFAIIQLSIVLLEQRWYFLCMYKGLP